MDDVEENGCLACPFSSVDLGVWALDEPVETSEDAQAVVGAREPDAALRADQRYELELAAGPHLLCGGRYTCIPIDVRAGETLTVNLAHPLGPSGGYYVARPGAVFEEPSPFEVDLSE